MAARKQTTGRAAAVWRFVDYEGRFAPSGMPADREVAQYVKWYLNGWKGPGGEWLVAVNRLRAEKEFIWYQGAIVELLTVAMNQSLEFQGALVTGSKVPMQASDVGSILRVDGRKAHAVLTRLEQVGILERVAWPRPDDDGEIQDDRSLRLLTEVSRAARKDARKTAGKGGRKRGLRAENADEPLKGGRSEGLAAQDNIEGTAGVRDAAPPTPPGGQAAARAAETVKAACPRCGLAATLRNVRSRATCPNCRHRWNHEPVKTPTPKTPTASTSPDAGGGPAGPARAGRHAAPCSDAPQVVRLADCLVGQGHRYSEAGNAFGEQVLAASGYVAADRGDYVNEVAHWAKLYERCRAELSEAGIERVRAKVLRVAARIRGRRHEYGAPEAYLERTMQNEIRDRKRACHSRSG